MSQSKGLVILSGGLDSTTCMAIASKFHKSLFAVTFTYGQKHINELHAAGRVASYYRAGHRVIELPEVFGGTESVLVAENKLDMPQMSYEELDDTYGVSPTYVPFRNANLISMATAVALVEECDTVYAGMHAEDAHNWAYPDCTPEFLGSMANAVYVGSYHKVRFVAPLMWMSKSDVVHRALELHAPIDLTLSCYEGTDPACGTCPTCVGRINAFRDVGAVDPIKYAIEIDWEG